MSAIIDLSGRNPLNQEYVVDENTGILTLTLFEGGTALGEIKIERVRLRAFAEALVEMARTVTSDTDVRQRARMLYNVQEKSAEIRFG